MSASKKGAPSLFCGGGDLRFQPRAQTSGTAGLHWAVGPDGGHGLLAGWAEWDRASAPPKTLDYDEVILVLEGRFGVALQDGSRLEGGPGDLLYIPRGSTVDYFGEDARIFFAITPPGAA